MVREDREMEAARITDSPLFDEIFREMELSVVEYLKLADKRDIELLKVLALHLTVIGNVKENFEAFAKLGKMAKYQIELENRMN